jgi:hypothetical protein
MRQEWRMKIQTGSCMGSAMADVARVCHHWLVHHQSGLQASVSVIQQAQAMGIDHILHRIDMNDSISSSSHALNTAPESVTLTATSSVVLDASGWRSTVLVVRAIWLFCCGLPGLIGIAGHRIAT